MDLSKNDLEKIEDLYESILSESGAEEAGRATRELIRRGTKWAIEKGSKAADVAVTGTTDFMRGLGLKGSIVLGPGSTIPIDKPKPEPRIQPRSPASQPTPTAKQPPVRDSGREAGEWLAPSRGSSRAADPLVKQGGSYGFFGPIRPQVTKQPPVKSVKPGDTTVKRDPKGAIIVNHFEVENDQVVSEAPAQVAPITGPGGKGWYQKNKQGKYVPITDPEKAKEAAARWKAEQNKSKPPAPQPSTRPAPQPSSTRPAPQPSSTRPAPQPPARQPAPQSSPVAKYMAAAAAARKSGDPAQMAKVRDMGMEIWRKKYASTLAKNVNPDGTQKGTGQSVMAKQADELRNLRPPVPAPGNEKPGYSGPPTPTGPQAQSSLPGGAYSPAATAKMTTRTKNILGVKEQYDAYDLVLEYLFSEGHVDTLEEAHYVMMQMSSEYIQEIIQERWSWTPKDWGKPEATPKNVARETPSRGYNPNTGTTKLGTPQTGYKDKIMASRGGVAGAMVKGKPETWAPVISNDPGVKDAYARYRTLRGYTQLYKDAKNNAYVSATNKAFDAKYADVYKNTKTEREGLGPRPEAPAPKPAAKPVATAPASPKPKPPTIQSKNVTATGTSYERRTPTSAELAAAKAAGGGEAGIKAAVDVAKTNKIAATSPTPDLKPEAPKKRESLAAQLKDLQTMRKGAEERNKGTN